MRFTAQLGISVLAGLLVNGVTWADPILLIGPPTLTVATHAFAPGGFPVSAGDSSDAKTSNSGPLTSSIDGVTYVGTSTANALATDLGEVGVSADITGFYNVSPLDAESTATWSQTYQNTSGAAASFTVIQTLYPMSIDFIDSNSLPRDVTPYQASINYTASFDGSAELDGSLFQEGTGFSSTGCLASGSFTTFSINQISTGFQQACTVDGTFLTYQTPLIANDGTFTLSYTANVKVSGNVPFGDDVSASFGDPAKISGFGTAAQLTLNTSSTVPEPGSLSLLAACVFALGGTTVGRKRST